MDGVMVVQQVSLDPPRYPTATLHEAAGQTGALPYEIKPLVSSFRIWGPALPVATTALDNLWIHRALLVAKPGDVVVVAPSESQPAGYWGEILSNAALARGIGGVVIDGHCRDGERLVDIGPPVFSRGLCIRGTKKDPESVGSIGEPIAVGDVVIHRGDLVVGDGDGVVVIPASEVERIMAAAEERELHEDEVMALLAQGATTMDIYGLDHRGSG
jgi:4-hydroxy-4-methyl-2-oxoglutarate aldolase